MAAQNCHSQNAPTNSPLPVAQTSRLPAFERAGLLSLPSPDFALILEKCRNVRDYAIHRGDMLRPHTFAYYLSCLNINIIVSAEKSRMSGTSLFSGQVVLSKYITVQREETIRPNKAPPFQSVQDHLLQHLLPPKLW